MFKRRTVRSIERDIKAREDELPSLANDASLAAHQWHILGGDKELRAYREADSLLQTTMHQIYTLGKELKMAIARRDEDRKWRLAKKASK